MRTGLASPGGSFGNRPEASYRKPARQRGSPWGSAAPGASDQTMLLPIRFSRGVHFSHIDLASSSLLKQIYAASINRTAGPLGCHRLSSLSLLRLGSPSGSDGQYMASSLGKHRYYSTSRRQQPSSKLGNLLR